VAAIAAALPQRLDALCNVAGLSGAPGAAPTVAVNFYGLRALSEAVAEHIRPGGAVVSVASIAGYGWRANLDRARSMVAIAGFPDVAAVLADHNVAEPEGYPLSKELLLLWTQLAAQQPLFKARRVRVVAVSPGPVETPILGQFRQVFGDARVDSDIAAAGRAGTPSDIAPVVAFLCSDGARWINGTNIAADGGLEAAVNAQSLGF
jgi:NAD(P)-dependent dehydrogenase (short-subunit alcohol dehydrogenase family)